MGKRRTYRLIAEDQWLPSGFVTRDVRRYNRAWRTLGRTLTTFFGKRCFGCNPGFLFEGPRESTRIASEDAIKIWELINKRKWKD